jgi:hypothetical protein
MSGQEKKEEDIGKGRRKCSLLVAGGSSYHGHMHGCKGYVQIKLTTIYNQQG